MAAAIAILFFITTFLAAAVAVMVAAFVQSRIRTLASAKSDLGLADSPDPEDEGPVLLQQTSHSTIGLLEQLLQRTNVIDILRNRMDDAGLKWSVGRVVSMMLLIGSVFSALTLNIGWLPTGSAIAAFVIGAAVPYLYIKRRRQKRIEKLEAQFPDALEGLARAMRAGHPLQGAIDILAGDVPAPLGLEFRRIRDERSLGMPWKQALENFASRVPILEVRLFVAAAILNTRTGGKFTEVMENLAETIREGAALRGEVKAISAHGRLTGTILTVLPFGIAGMLWLTAPSYLQSLFNHPFGPTLIGGALALIVAGHFVIQRIVRIQA